MISLGQPGVRVESCESFGGERGGPLAVFLVLEEQLAVVQEADVVFVEVSVVVDAESADRPDQVVEHLHRDQLSLHQLFFVGRVVVCHFRPLYHALEVGFEGIL